MKTLVLSGLTILLLGTISCNNGRYVDLDTGKHVELKKDPETGMMVNADTNEPVGLYVDTETHDTIYNKTGVVVNGKVVKNDDGKYKYEADGDYKVKEGDYKKKVDEDGSVKIKDGDTKIKIDEDGEKKVKSD